MTEPQDPAPGGHRYVIRVQEQLDIDWSAWFEGMTITREEGGVTVLVGRVADQSMLYGLLAKLQALNLSLISLRRADDNGGRT